MSSRGRLPEERNRNTNSSGKSPCTASPEPVRRAANSPIAPKASVIRSESAKITKTPPMPAAKLAPAAKPTSTYVSACTNPSTRAPASKPVSSAGARGGSALGRERAPGGHALLLGLLLAGTLERATGLGEEHIVQGGGVELDVGDGDLPGVERAHHVGELALAAA